MRLCTLGYQGLTLEAYVATLEAAGVGVLLDVREVPWSRKPGFSKKPLSLALEAAGVEYLHVKSAGNPSAIRKTAPSPAECMRMYGEYLDRTPDVVDELLAHVRAAWSRNLVPCLTCFERLPEECHRKVLADALAARDPSIAVEHLEAGAQPRLV